MLLLVQRHGPRRENSVPLALVVSPGLESERHRALVGSRTHGADVRVIDGAGQAKLL